MRTGNAWHMAWQKYHRKIVVSAYLHFLPWILFVMSSWSCQESLLIFMKFLHFLYRYLYLLCPFSLCSHHHHHHHHHHRFLLATEAHTSRWTNASNLKMLSLRVSVIYENGCHSIFKFYCASSVARWCYLSQSPQRDFCQPLHGSEEQNLKLSGVNNLFTRNTFKRFSDKKNKETNEPKKNKQTNR